jgi:hypothetical protein
MIGGGVIMSEPISHQTKLSAGEEAPKVAEALDIIRDSLRGLRFGSVNIIVQDGVVIQIDRTEKQRLRSARSNP